MKIELYRTKSKRQENKYLTEKQELVFYEDKKGIESNLVNIYPEIEFQTFEGIGGAITDSAAYVYSLMSPEQKKQVIRSYFLKDEMNYKIVRIHLDSCDFSVSQYEAMSNEEDLTLESFSFERTEKYIIPMLEDANEAAGGGLKLMLSPWSPPKFMKTNNDRNHGGSIKPQYRKLWAEYLCRYIEEFKKRGYQVQRISLQNEPKAVQTWDSCVYTAEEEKIFLRDFMYPALKEHKLDDIEVFIWDHNKERAYERARTIIDEHTKDMVAGVACHWYSGDHFENLDHLQHRYPGLKMIISESCIEYSKFEVGDEAVNAARLSHEIIGDLNHGIMAFYDWNLLLDESGGPNHVGNYCQAPFLYDRERKELMPQLLQKHFYHFSHFIMPGARRIAFSKYTDKLDVTSWRNPDGTIITVILNWTDRTLPVVVRMDDQVQTFALEPYEICTGKIADRF